MHSNSMKHVTPQQQVWALLQTDDQRAILAANLRHLKKLTQEDICYGIIAFLRWGIIRPFEDQWVNRHFQSLVLFLRTEKELGNL